MLIDFILKSSTDTVADQPTLVYNKFEHLQFYEYYHKDLVRTQRVAVKPL